MLESYAGPAIVVVLLLVVALPLALAMARSQRPPIHRSPSRQDGPGAQPDPVVHPDDISTRSLGTRDYTVPVVGESFD